MNDANVSLPQVLPADAEGIARAVSLLMNGQCVAVPTETVYGLAARADDDDAVAAIYAAKGRPSFNPLIVHIPDLAAAERLARFDGRARRLAQRFWPGSLTLVLPSVEDAALAPAVTAGLPSVALRCPSHPVMQALLQSVPFPLAAPSANRSGAVSPTCAAHVAASLAGRIPLVLDGGKAERGLESTIVALRDNGWQLLRPGPVSEADIADVLGPCLPLTSTAIEAPGQLESHYAPGKPVRLGASDLREGEFRIGFGDDGGDFNLSPTGDLIEAGARLYTALHAGAVADNPAIAVVPIPAGGIGAAINDRLRRAAA